MSLLVEIELCRNCHLHSWCSRHDEVKYIDYYEQLAQRIITAIPEVKVIQRKPSDDIAVRKTPANDGALYYNINTGQAVHFPRLGSFEVYVDGVRLFSKLKSKIWPKFDKVIEKIKQLQTAKQNGQDMKIYDVDYVDPNTKPRVNADLYNIQTIFRVRKSSVKNQTNYMSSTGRESRQRQVNKSVQLDKRFNQFNPQFDAMFQQINPKPDKQTNKWLQKWNLQDGPHNPKPSPYLAQVLPKQKRRKLLMSKLDSKHILLENQEGQRVMYKKQEKIDHENQRLNIDSGTSGGNTIRGTSRHNRRKLAPLPNNKTNAKINQNNLNDQEKQKQEVNLYDQLDLSQQQKQDLLQKQKKTINEGKETKNQNVKSSKKIDNKQIKEHQSQQQYQHEQIQQQNEDVQKTSAKAVQIKDSYKQNNKEEKQQLNAKSNKIKSQIKSQKYSQQAQQEQQNQFDGLELQMNKSGQEQEQANQEQEQKVQQINQQQQPELVQQLQDKIQDKQEQAEEEVIQEEQDKIDVKKGDNAAQQKQGNKQQVQVVHKQTKQSINKPEQAQEPKQTHKKQVQQVKSQQQIKKEQMKQNEENTKEIQNKEQKIKTIVEEKSQNSQENEYVKNYQQHKWKCKYIQSQFHLIQDIPQQMMQKEKNENNTLVLNTQNKINQNIPKDSKVLDNTIPSPPIIEEQQESIKNNNEVQQNEKFQAQNENNEQKQQQGEVQKAVSPFRKQAKPIIVKQPSHQAYAYAYQKYEVLSWDTKVKYQSEEYLLVGQHDIDLNKDISKNQLESKNIKQENQKTTQKHTKDNQNSKEVQNLLEQKIDANSINWVALFQQGKYKLRKSPINLSDKINDPNNQKDPQKTVT